jgi:hypothetical protein
MFGNKLQTGKVQRMDHLCTDACRCTFSRLLYILSYVKKLF